MEPTIEETKKKNRNLLIIFKMLSYDFLFFYTISYLFMANVKGLSASQIVFGEAFYPMFKIFLQIPCTFIVQKLGKKKSLLIANISLLIYMLIIIGLINTLSLIIANIFCAFGYVIKGMCESTLIYDSIDNGENKRELFSKYEGRANAAYYFVDAITAILAGFLFAINPYIPLVLSSIVIIISICVAHNLVDINKVEETKEISVLKQLRNYFNDVKVSTKFIFRSERLKALILYDSLLVALLTITVNLRTSLLNELHVSSQNFGLIFSVMGLISCIAATRALKIHLKHKNKTLSLIGITYTISIFICSLVVFLHFPKFLMYYIILIMFSIQYFDRGSFQTIIKQYFNSFCDSKMRLKIYSTSILIESLTTTTLSIICSLILKVFSASTTILLVGTFSSIAIILILKYMSSRIGLKPEEYPEKDIDYSDLLQ